MADISNVFVSSIAQTLNTAGIPCVLWGHYLLQAHGVPTVVDVSLQGITVLPYYPDTYPGSVNRLHCAR